MDKQFSRNYQALKSHDRRFDGRLFVGVSSTGIYCRPVCPARLPKQENCQFFSNAAAAEHSGFRPCKRCRPELAPGFSCVDMPGSLLSEACRLISCGFLDHSTVEQLSERLGVSSRHLRRLFQDSMGISPNDFALNRRLLQAVQLITDTHLPLSEIALQSGFKSLRSFNHLFQQKYQQSPGSWRKSVKNSDQKTISFKLGYRPPYDWQAMLRFLSNRMIPGVEQIEDGEYRRTARMESASGEPITGWIVVSHLEDSFQLQIQLSGSLASVMSDVLARVRRLFDLDCDPEAINDQLGSLVENPGLRLPGAFDGFEMCVRAVLGQQITVKAAHTLATRLATAFGQAIETPFSELSVTFPSPATVASLRQEQLGELGVVRQRCKAIFAIANAISQKEIELSALSDIPDTLEKLQALPGIGPWTAQYIAMRALSWPDAFPDSDLGIIKAVGSKKRKEILELSQKWSPWRAYAVMHLWHRPADRPPLLSDT
ncbi:AlkA N-terminal domain-containing protein [Endozoicomonas arenosclerae]|uniref:AlkA N-terminal domain-containing protein n=1 Tax=Endozoicomonas arenosclerae TaxID=1633495 RepID=UPI000780FB98|nr:AlkA N-terminal domain-containing protein [Endozoicomonas arenosclerae]